MELRPGIAFRICVVGVIAGLALFASASRSYPLDARADASPEQLARGTAATPYQYRVLVPLLVRVTTDTADSRAMQRRYRQLDLIALLAIGFGFRRYLSRFTARRHADVMAPAIFALLPFNYGMQDFYPYDMPALAFTVWGLVLLGERRFAAFYLLYIAATFNRESSLFLAGATAAIWYGRQPHWQTAAHLCAQLGIWLAIKWYLFVTFDENVRSGLGLFVPQLKMNAALLFGLPHIAASTLWSWGMLWLPVIVRYSRLHSIELRRTLMLVPAYVAAMLVVGVVNETRIYGEMLPIVAAAAFVIFVDYVRSDVQEI